MWKRTDNNFRSIDRRFNANINVNGNQSRDIVVLESDVYKLNERMKKLELNDRSQLENLRRAFDVEQPPIK